MGRLKESGGGKRKGQTPDGEEIPDLLPAQSADSFRMKVGSSFRSENTPEEKGTTKLRKSLTLLQDAGRDIHRRLLAGSRGLILPGRHYTLRYEKGKEYSFSVNKDGTGHLDVSSQKKQYELGITQEEKRRLYPVESYELNAPNGKGDGFHVRDLKVVGKMDGKSTTPLPGEKKLLPFLYEKISANPKWKRGKLDTVISEEKWTDDLAKAFDEFETFMVVGRKRITGKPFLELGTHKILDYNQLGIFKPMGAASYFHDTQKKRYEAVAQGERPGIRIHTHHVDEGQNPKEMLCPGSNDNLWCKMRNITEAIFAHRPEQDGSFLGVLAVPNGKERWWPVMKQASTQHILERNYHWTYLRLTPDGKVQPLPRDHFSKKS